jgi:hypothetical protein
MSVFSLAALYRISFTPHFSEVYGQIVRCTPL